MAHRIIDTCNGCSACARQCPTDAITGAFKERYRVEEPLCIDCGVCGMICPVEAVVDAAGVLARRLPRSRRPRPVFDPALCNGCSLCATFCPERCIGLIGPAYQGAAYLADPQRCVSCGECATICIKRAVRMEALELSAVEPDAERARVREAIQACAPSNSEVPK